MGLFKWNVQLQNCPCFRTKIHVLLCIQLEELLSNLPEKLVVFVTHHHLDHIEGKLWNKELKE